MSKNIAILGCTGSIGVSTLEVAAQHPDRLRVIALAAGDNVELLAQQVQAFSPDLVSVRTEEGAARLRGLLGDTAPEIGHGAAGLEAVATHSQADVVVSAIVGAAGLEPTYRAIEAGKNIALANKETLVMAGPIILRAVKKHGVSLLPVDSEHAAILQSLQGHQNHEVRRLILTASGGPFREWDRERIAKATAADALAHPTWKMGPKITIDSATLMNKGLEIIEAHWLFDLPPEQIDVVIHTESIIHSMVEFHDGQVVAQLGVPDMKAPIAYALTYPNRLPDVIEPLNLAEVGQLNFFSVDVVKFPCLQLAAKALGMSELAPAALNAANEVAVSAFLAEKIGFYDISQTIEEVLKIEPGGEAHELNDVQAADRHARERTGQVIERITKERQQK